MAASVVVTRSAPAVLAAEAALLRSAAAAAQGAADARTLPGRRALWRREGRARAKEDSHGEGA